jgi:selenocysteine lyase/cysteine desulfurase
MDVGESLVTENSTYLTEEIKGCEQLELLSLQRDYLKSGIVTFKHKHISNAAIYNNLQENGVVCAMRGGGIRLSPHFYNTTQEIQRALAFVLHP